MKVQVKVGNVTIVFQQARRRRRNKHPYKRKVSSVRKRRSKFYGQPQPRTVPKAEQKQHPQPVVGSEYLYRPPHVRARDAEAKKQHDIKEEKTQNLLRSLFIEQQRNYWLNNN